MRYFDYGEDPENYPHNSYWDETIITTNDFGSRREVYARAAQRRREKKEEERPGYGM